MVKNLHKSKKWLILATAVLIGLATVFYLQVLRADTPVRQSTPHATIKKLPAQPATNNGEKNVKNTGSNNQGTATDNHGVTPTPVTSNPSQWAQSESGVITLKQPISGSTIKSGAELSGSASVTQVQYRLIDDQVGVISQGFISVVNGSFSGSISFQPHGGSGRLDVFSTDKNGAETNEVQLPVKF